MITYESLNLKNRLEKLSSEKRTLFAIACGQRMFDKLSDKTPNEIVSLLKKSLDALRNNFSTEDEIRSLYDECNSAINETTEIIGAQIIYALECKMNGSTQSAEWTANCLYEKADSDVIERLNVDHVSKEIEQKILEDNEMQKELNWLEETMVSVEQS